MSPLRRRRNRPVLILPGFAASDSSTIALRGHLRSLGHPVHGWGLGRNDGPTRETVNGLIDRVDALRDRYDERISIVGWSLGGVYAWSLARRDPDAVRLVITLGSPLRRVTGNVAVLPVPTTSIWSRNDSVVSWRGSIIHEGPQSENVEVRSTHFTLGFDPFVGAVIADRLGQPGDTWKPFRAPWWAGRLYPDRPQPRPAESSA